MKKLKFIIVLTLIIFGLSIITLNLVGFKTYRVISDSMAPSIYKNSLAIIKNYNENDDLNEKDIIAFSVNGKLVLHRIEEIDGDKIVTKGDANSDLDSPISHNDVVGIYVFSIPLIGILFASIYPWLIIILSILAYNLVILIVKEIKKDNGGK